MMLRVSIARLSMMNRVLFRIFFMIFAFHIVNSLKQNLFLFLILIYFILETHIDFVDFVEFVSKLVH